MKYALGYTLFLMFVFHSSCGQNQTNTPQDNVSKGNYSEDQLKAADTTNVPISMVRNVRQDRNGNILIASYLGVFRYDVHQHDTIDRGTSFTNLTSKIISLRYSSFWDVLEDRKGNLWFGTKDSGVYYHNGGSLQHFTTKDGLGSNRIVKIYEDRASNIWFATGGGASRFLNDTVGQGKTFRNFTTKDGLPNNDFTTIMEDKSGRIWIGTRGEACYYDARLDDEVGKGKAFTVFRDKDGKAFNNVWSIIEDKKGNIWFGDGDGLWRYDGSSFANVSQRAAYSIIEDKKGNIWTSGEVNPNVWAISRYDAKSLYNKIPTITEIKTGGRMDFLSLLEAKDGSIWVGCKDGVYRYDAPLNDPVGQGKTFTDFKSKGHKK